MKNINNVVPDETVYLKKLSYIANPPKRLWYVGKLPSTEVKTVAIVGSRKVSHYGREVTYNLAYELAKRGVVIVSGLAIGVDGIAHQAALDAKGTTIAVLGNGLPDIYPGAHQKLAQQIVAQGGAIITEYEPGIEAKSWTFLMRNRIVSGLADAVIVTEAASRSGTLNTAGHALNQGRELGAVPGNITSPMSAGCNSLLRSGAAPITHYRDILELLGVDEEKTSKQTSLLLADTPEEAILLELLQGGVRDGQELLDRSNLDASTFNQTLSMLEITTKIRPLGANQWTLR
jgi:DNA processing protein